MNKVSFIIPCLNHWDITKRFLQSLYAHTDKEYFGETIIIDDNSTDETKEELPKNLKYDYKIIRHDDINRGFSASVNDGIKCSKYNFICIFNNDFYMAPNWLDGLFKYTNGYGMVSSTLIEPDRCLFENFEEYYTNYTDQGIDKTAKGMPWLFKKEVFDTVGLFDESLGVATYEDSDMLLRMAYAKIYFGKVKESLCYHWPCSTQNGELQKRIGTDYRYLARVAFEQKWGTLHIDFDKAYSGLPQV